MNFVCIPELVVLLADFLQVWDQCSLSAVCQNTRSALGGLLAPYHLAAARLLPLMRALADRRPLLHTHQHEELLELRKNWRYYRRLPQEVQVFITLCILFPNSVILPASAYYHATRCDGKGTLLATLHTPQCNYCIAWERITEKYRFFRVCTHSSLQLQASLENYLGRRAFSSAFIPKGSEGNATLFELLSTLLE